MNNLFTRRTNNPVNYHCPVCMKSKKLPNIAGRFFIINKLECQCNGCNKIFPKTQFYRSIK